MLSENISRLRKERGLTQEALAVKLNVVRQTVSKWEKGAAVPDAEMLCRLAEALDTTVTELLGAAAPVNDRSTEPIVRALAEINEQLAARNRRAHRIWKIVKICLLSLLAALILLTVLNIAAFSAFSFRTESGDVQTVTEETVTLPEEGSVLLPEAENAPQNGK